MPDEKTKPTEYQIRLDSIIFPYNLDDKSLLGPFTALLEGNELDAGALAMDVKTHTLRRTQRNLGRPANNPGSTPRASHPKGPKTCKLPSLETQNA